MTDVVSQTLEAQSSLSLKKVRSGPLRVDGGTANQVGCIHILE